MLKVATLIIIRPARMPVATRSDTAPGDRFAESLHRLVWEHVMPLLSDYARRKKIEYFFADIPKDARILEVGSGEGWVGEYLKTHGWKNYLGIDIKPPADIVGDLREWGKLGLEPASYDVIVAFEVIEHVDLFQEMYDLLRPGGKLLITTPVPHMDWACKILERVGLNQQRTSPHDHLTYFKDIPLFEPVDTRIVKLIGQWGKFRKPLRAST
jgi:2-polyprenyl-3-methyl-5-hydroxy-6-metoxy-1,4-benzoquinol methylase